MSRYGWIITKDVIAAPDEAAEVGTMGPSNIDPHLQRRLKDGDGDRFRLLDDDGEVYYEGLIILTPQAEGEDLFAPLDDFGTPYAGCARIQYWEDGEWKRL